MVYIRRVKSVMRASLRPGHRTFTNKWKDVTHKYRYLFYLNIAGPRV
jgi:hypothetical protein